jgi:hypothetical protein
VENNLKPIKTINLMAQKSRFLENDRSGNFYAKKCYVGRAYQVAPIYSKQLLRFTLLQEAAH